MRLGLRRAKVQVRNKNRAVLELARAARRAGLHLSRSYFSRIICCEACICTKLYSPLGRSVQSDGQLAAACRSSSRERGVKLIEAQSKHCHRSRRRRRRHKTSQQSCEVDVIRRYLGQRSTSFSTRENMLLPSVLKPSVDPAGFRNSGSWSMTCRQLRRTPVSKLNFSSAIVGV